MKNQVKENQNSSSESSGPLKTSELESLVAGRELDAAVAVRVMTARCDCDGSSRSNPHGIESFCPVHSTGPRGQVPHYSTDIAAAWQIVEHLQKQSCMVSVNASSDFGLWWCVVYPQSGELFLESETCLSAPEAICRAALQATSTDASPRWSCVRVLKDTGA